MVRPACVILKLHFGARADPCADSRLTAVSRERERVSVTYFVCTLPFKIH